MNNENKYRVIILEQTDVIRNILSDFFNDRGYEVHAYSETTFCPLHLLPECRCSYEETCCDMMIVDVDNPEIDGLTFVENVRKKDCKCSHILLISSLWNQAHSQKALSLNCRVISKPFPVSSLVEWVTEAEAQINTKRHLRDWIFETKA